MDIKNLAKRSAIMTGSLIAVGTFIAPLISGLTSSIGLTISGLPTTSNFSGDLMSQVVGMFGLFVGVMISLAMTDFVVKMKKQV